METETMKKYYEARITPHHGGFGVFQIGEFSTEGWETLSDMEMEISDWVGQEIYRLGEDILPDGLADIRGQVQNEPEIIFGWLDENGVARYTGIVSR